MFDSAVFIPVLTVVGAFHSQDQSLPNSTGHQPMSQQPGGQGNGFSRQSQSFYNSRGMSRGGPRGSRGMMNGYRGQSNGFRGSNIVFAVVVYSGFH